MPQKRKKLASTVAAVRVTLEDVEVKSQQHLQSIMRAVGVKTLRAPNGNPVFAFDDLKSENKYKPGDPKEQVASKRPRGRGISKYQAIKAVPSAPHEVRGPLADRAEDQKRARYDASVGDDVAPYADTIWLRDRGHLRPMSLNKVHLQRRFDRLGANLVKLKAELKTAKAESESAEQLCASYEAQLEKANADLDATQADLYHLINDVQVEDGPNEVSFRADTGEYDPSFVLCVMFALTFTSYEVAIKIIKFVYETLTGKKIVDNPTRKFQQDCFRRLGVLEEMQV